MRLVKSEVEKIKTYTAVKLDPLVDEVLKADTDVLEVKDWEQDYKSVYSCTVAVNCALRRRSAHSFKCVARKGVPYIVKTSVL